MTRTNRKKGSKGSTPTSSQKAGPPELDESGNKRKVLRTVNVSAGGGPPQAMTPEAAAKYIQQATTSRGREVKISFGPARPNATSQNRAPGTGSTSAVSFGSLDLNALKETAAAAAAAHPPGAGGPNLKDGLPCSEAEMKALMSMFVEIMGMSMEGDKTKGTPGSKRPAMHHTMGGMPFPMSGNMPNNNTSGPPGASPVFMFGNNGPPGWTDSDAMAAATAGFFADGDSWEALRRTYGASMGMDHGNDSEDNEDDSMPDLDEVREIFSKASHVSAALGQPGGTKTGDTVIAPGEWESLEQVAIDDALETEERERKATKKREKKQRKKLKQKEEAAQKANEAAQKKREKAILSWRSRVVSACHSCEATKVDALLQESPLRLSSRSPSIATGDDMSVSVILPHLQFLLPNSIAKNRSQLEKGKEARHRLAVYILDTDVMSALSPLRTGRTALHTACFHGDLPFVQLLFQKLAFVDSSDPRLPPSYVDMTCDDSGWTPLHYAAVSGSMEVLEAILAGGGSVSTITDDTHTWRQSDGGGVTARDLVQYIRNGKYEKVLESHGVALQEMQHSWLGNQQDRRIFMKFLERVLRRLDHVEAHGYTPPAAEKANDLSEKEETTQTEPPQESASARKRKKKKKKKQAQKEGEATKKQSMTKAPEPQESTATEATIEEDPLIVALVGMGFTRDQISAAVKACGGTNRATADDLLTWILGQDADGQMVGASEEAEPQDSSKKDETAEVNESTVIKTKLTYEAKQTEDEERQKEEAAKRLAAKREEQRRRNREWNNREQARQEQEAKVKVSQAHSVPREQTQPMTAGYGTAFPALQNRAQYSGLPDSSQKVAVTSATANLSEAYVTQPKQILKAPSGKARGVASAKLPPQTASLPESKLKVAPVASASEFPSLPRALPPSSARSISDMGKSMSRSPPPPVATLNVFPHIGDDDKTVSSFGSNRGLSVSSASFVSSLTANAPPQPSPAIAPPGFRATVSEAVPMATAAAQHVPLINPRVEPSSAPEVPMSPNLLGEMRATAKAFIPTSFAPGVAPARQESFPGLSTSFVSQPASQMAMTDKAQDAAVDSFETSVGFQPGLLHGSSGGPSLLRPSIPREPPVSKESIPVPSTDSSLAGVPVLDEASLGVNLGFHSEPLSSSGAASSVLTSAFTNGPPIGGASIWGGSQNVPSLGGLPPISFGDNDHAKESRDQSTHKSTGWKASNGQDLTGGTGSIW